MNILFFGLFTLLFTVSTLDAASGADDDYGRSHPDGLIIPSAVASSGQGPRRLAGDHVIRRVVSR